MGKGAHIKGGMGTMSKSTGCLLVSIERGSFPISQPVRQQIHIELVLGNGNIDQVSRDLWDLTVKIGQRDSRMFGNLPLERFQSLLWYHQALQVLQVVVEEQPVVLHHPVDLIGSSYTIGQAKPFGKGFSWCTPPGSVFIKDVSIGAFL